jgi:hypothetical protein
MSRKLYIITLLFLSWILANVHRIWNNTMPVNTNPFPFDKDYTITWHWYIHSILKDISFLSILIGLWLYVNSNLKRDRGIILIFGAILVNYIIDIPHYILWARHSETVLTIQGLIMLIAAYKLFVKYLRKL